MYICVSLLSLLLLFYLYSLRPLPHPQFQGGRPQAKGMRAACETAWQSWQRPSGPALRAGIVGLRDSEFKGILSRIFRRPQEAGRKAEAAPERGNRELLDGRTTPRAAERSRRASAQNSPGLPGHEKQLPCQEHRNQIPRPSRH